MIHRKSEKNFLEQKKKIMQDADYLDAFGAVDIARLIASSLQSKKYKRPIYVDEIYDGNENKFSSSLINL
ncbi:MAG: hypothetical protein ACOYT4_00870 [Nanoarchaeota archaeon]